MILSTEIGDRGPLARERFIRFMGLGGEADASCLYMYIFTLVYIYSRTRQFCNVRENFVVGPQGHLIRSSLYLYIYVI